LTSSKYAKDADAFAAPAGGGKMQGRTADVAVKQQRYDAVV
jgi:hypothetical protein